MPRADRHLASPFEIVNRQTAILDALEPLSVRELSSDGMLIESPNPLEVGSIHEFQLINGAISVRVCAAVRRLSPLRESGDGRYFLVDLKFMNVSTRSPGVVERWLKEKSGRSTRKGA